MSSVICMGGPVAACGVDTRRQRPSGAIDQNRARRRPGQRIEQAGAVDMVAADNDIGVAGAIGRCQTLARRQPLQPIGRGHPERRRAIRADDQNFARRHATAFIFRLTVGNSLGYP